MGASRLPDCKQKVATKKKKKKKKKKFYKMCPFDQCSQRSKSGGAETRLGSWGEWTGPDHSRHSSMKFVGGQTCWNGPARSTAVYLHCGGDNSLTAVSEPNRCEYEMHFTTPAACHLTQPGSSHDEL